jgi:DksA/TraR C4-type zinc finger protein
MTENRTIQLAAIPFAGKGGYIWNRLHGEREEICETLVGISGPNSSINGELLQARLRKLDDALDRLMSESYGLCSRCGQPINEIKLYTDPATELCLDCSGIKPAAVIRAAKDFQPQIAALQSLNQFDSTA